MSDGSLVLGYRIREVRVESGGEETKFIVVRKQKTEFILVLLCINSFITFHMDNCKTTVQIFSLYTVYK